MIKLSMTEKIVWILYALCWCVIMVVSFFYPAYRQILFKIGLIQSMLMAAFVVVGGCWNFIKVWRTNVRIKRSLSHLEYARFEYNMRHIYKHPCSRGDQKKFLNSRFTTKLLTPIRLFYGYLMIAILVILSVWIVSMPISAKITYTWLLMHFLAFKYVSTRSEFFIIKWPFSAHLLISAGVAVIIWVSLPLGILFLTLWLTLFLFLFLRGNNT